MPHMSSETAVNQWFVNHFPLIADSTLDVDIDVDIDVGGCLLPQVKRAHGF